MFRRWLLIAVSLAAVATLSTAQDEGFLKKAPNAGESRVRANEMRDGRRRVLTGPEETRNKADLLKMAQALMYPVTEPQYYLPPEPNPRNPSELRPTPSNVRFDSQLDDIDRYVLRPGFDSKLNFDQYDYLITLGDSFDATLKELFKLNAPAHVRVNTARMLALVAHSGAPAHAGMITELIADPNTPPEILNYALQAAGNLLAAYDPRKAGGVQFGDHTIKDAELVKLVLALEAVVNRQTPYGPKKAMVAKPAPAEGIVKEAPKDVPAKKDEKEPPKADAKAPPAKPAGKLDATPAMPFDEEQAMVIRYLRRHAIRALAQVRMPIVQDAKSNTTARPLFTLCRVAVNDGPFAPALDAPEYADAVLGLLNLHSIRNVDVDVVANCIAIGTRNFTNFKGTTSGGIMPWKTYGVKLNTAIENMQRTMANTAAMQSATAKLGPLLSLLATKIAMPLETISRTNPTGSGLQINAVVDWLRSRTVTGMCPYSDVREPEKTKLTLKPVDPN